MTNFKYELNRIISGISENQEKLILKSIKKFHQLGLKIYWNGSLNREQFKF